MEQAGGEKLRGYSSAAPASGANMKSSVVFIAFGARNSASTTNKVKALATLKVIPERITRSYSAQATLTQNTARKIKAIPNFAFSTEISRFLTSKIRELV